MLRWNDARKYLSYFVPPTGAEKGRFVMISPEGKVIGERVIRQDPAVYGIRGVERFDWLPDGRARVDGSTNPRSCQMFDLDPDTNEESNWQFGACGSFVISPDGQRTAELGAVAQTDEEHRYNTVDIDSQAVRGLGATAVYRGDGHPVFVLAGPVWSPDSKAVAVLESRADTGAVAVVIVRPDRTISRIPLPKRTFVQHEIDWPGEVVVVSAIGDPVVIDPVAASIVPLTAEITKQVQARSDARAAAEAHRSAIQSRIGQLGASEGVELTNWP
jgi:hypothetical protein